MNINMQINLNTEDELDLLCRANHAVAEELIGIMEDCHIEYEFKDHLDRV